VSKLRSPYTKCVPKKNSICGQCGGKGHNSTREQACKHQAKCANCDGPHAAFDRKCSIYIKEKEIIRVKTDLNISIPEARKKVEAKEQQPSAWTFPSTLTQRALQPSKRTTFTQCDDLLPGIPPLKCLIPLTKHIDQNTAVGAPHNKAETHNIITTNKHTNAEQVEPIINKTNTHRVENHTNSINQPALVIPVTQQATSRKSTEHTTQPAADDFYQSADSSQYNTPDETDPETAQAIRSITYLAQPNYITPNPFQAISMDGTMECNDTNNYLTAGPGDWAVQQS